MSERHMLAQHILDALVSKGAQEVECSITDSARTEVFYESGKISMIRTNLNSSVSMTAINSKRKGHVVGNSTDLEEIDNCAEQTIQAMNSAIPDDAEGIAETTESASHTRGIPEADMEAMFGAMQNFIAQAKQRYPLIKFDTISMQYHHLATLYANTNGARLEETNGFYVFSPMFMAVKDGKSSSFNATGVLFDDINSDLMALYGTGDSLAEAERQIDTVPVDGKFTGTVIFTPSCLGSLLQSMEGNFFSDVAILKGTSIFKDSLGKKIADERVTLRSEPRNEQLPGGSFINDGYVAENMDIIKDGVLKNFAISLYTAKKTGNKRSDSAGGNYVMSAGETPLAQMIASVEKGLLVNRFSGGRPAANGEFSGVAKNSFLIENGKVTDAVSETMISGNLAQLLLDVCDISREQLNDGDSILPWIKVSGITISGK